MSEAEPAQRGRTIDEELTGRILAATLAELGERGYAGLRIERIAKLVGCGKTAVYRRWPTRDALVAAVVNHDSVLGELPDTGDVVEDLTSHIWVNATNQGAGSEHRPDGAARIWGAIVEPEVLDRLWQGFLRERREMGMTIVRNGVARGQLPADTDADVLLDLFAGLVFYRNLMHGGHLDRERYREVVRAIVASPPRLPRE